MKFNVVTPKDLHNNTFYLKNEKLKISLKFEYKCICTLRKLLQSSRCTFAQVSMIKSIIMAHTLIAHNVSSMQ